VSCLAATAATAVVWRLSKSTARSRLQEEAERHEECQKKAEPQKCDKPKSQNEEKKVSPPTSKTIFLVRHGQSSYNEHYDVSFTDPMVFDADLTAQGKRDAVKAGKELLAHGGVELCVMSPLRRSINTCLGAMPYAEHHQHTRYEVCSQPLVISNSWIGVGCSCNVACIVSGLA
jgi:hypothetical protein